MSSTRVATGAPLTGSATAAGSVAGRASWRFYTCVGLLLVAAGGLAVFERMYDLSFVKEPVELVRPLTAFDKSKLAPDYELHWQPPPTLSPEIVKTLGTEDYVLLRVVDRNRPEEDPARVAHLFITYYTGKPDLVPHVPDECYVAGGFQRIGAENLNIPVAGVGAQADQMPIRVLDFEGVAGGGPLGSGKVQRSVLYFFHCNGRYMTTRNEVRMATSNLFEHYAYYAKFEINFTSGDLRRAATRAQSLEAVAPLLETVLPIFLDDHFQDFDQLGQTETRDADVADA